MNCKNCSKSLSDQSKFCDECGGKVVHDRITFKSLLSDLFTNAFGWDNKYFVTLRSLIISPHILFKEYINGTRKRYVNPFAFFAIGAAITLLVFNQFSNDYLRISEELNEKQMEAMNNVLVPNLNESLSENSTKNTDPDKIKKISSEELKEKQLELGNKIQKAILKYFNIVSFMLLPYYAFIAFLVFRKPYNYGEHLIMNAYLQGITFLFTTIFFLISLAVNPNIYFFGLALTITYYTYAYTRLYSLSWGNVIIKLLKFVVFTLLSTVILVITGGVIGFIFGESL